MDAIEIEIYYKKRLISFKTFTSLVNISSTSTCQPLLYLSISTCQSLLVNLYLSTSTCQPLLVNLYSTCESLLVNLYSTCQPLLVNLSRVRPHQCQNAAYPSSGPAIFLTLPPPTTILLLFR